MIHSFDIYSVLSNITCAIIHKTFMGNSLFIADSLFGHRQDKTNKNKRYKHACLEIRCPRSLEDGDDRTEKLSCGSPLVVNLIAFSVLDIAAFLIHD